jgi:uncharacterized sulfatase
MDGVPFDQLLRDPTDAFRDHAFIESYGGSPQDPTPKLLTHAKTIRTDRWRVTFFPEGSCGEVYDLYNDPDELHNLWFDPACETLIAQHYALLKRRVA